MSSKTVVIRREESSLEGLPKKIARDAKKTLSSVFVNSRPLEVRSERMDTYLESILGLRKDEPGFIRRREDFWKEISLEVPFGGRELEVGLSENGYPINLQHYIWYQWILLHPLVAKSEIDNTTGRRIPADEVMARELKCRFCLVDNSEEKQVQSEKIKVADKASELYHQDKHNVEKTKVIIRYLSPGTNVYNMDSEDLREILFELQQTQSEKYIKASTDKNVALRAEIANFREAGILVRSGNTYIYIDEVIGNNEDQVVAWMKNPRNGKTLLTMKAKLDEYMTSKYNIDSRFSNIQKDLEIPEDNVSEDENEEVIESAPADMPPGTDPQGAATVTKRRGRKPKSEQ